MRAVSGQFLEQVRGSHSMAVRATVCETFQTGTTPVGTVIPILDGDCAFDAAAAIRGTADVTTEPALWPTTASSLLAPYGNEVYLERGIVYGNGSTEWVGLGYFRIDSVEQDDAPRGAVQLGCSDRMAGIVDARLEAPRQYTAAMSVDTVVADLVLDVYPSAQIVYDFPAAATLLGRLAVTEDDRHGFLTDLVTAHGKIMYWDYAGRLQIKTAPDPTVPVWEVNHGAGGVLVKLARGKSREGVYNAVVAEGEGADDVAPVRGVARDLDPASPTYWFGSFGKVPRFYSSPFLVTAGQARATAAEMLRRAIGLPYTVSFDAVPNPALEVLDPVRVTYGGQRSETHTIQTITIPLTAEQAMPATTKEQTTVTIGVA